MASLFGDARWQQTDDSVWLYNCLEHKDLNLMYGRIYTEEKLRITYSNTQSPTIGSGR